MALPLLSIVVFAYNLERFVRDAVRSVLAQTYTPLEIILSDDCSSDRTFGVMQEEVSSYRGPHRIVLNRNEVNLGLGGHLNRVMQLVNGQLVIAAAGDDVSLPDRAAKIYKVYEGRERGPMSIFSSVLTIDEMGTPGAVDFSLTAFSPQDFEAPLLARRDFILPGCSHAWSRDVFDFFGPLLTPLSCEDEVIPFRSSLLGSIHYIDEPLVMYRRHADSTWVSNTADAIHREWFLSYERQNVYKNRLKDLEKIREKMPHRSEEIADLHAIVRERLTSVKEDIDLMEGNYGRKALVLLRSILRGEEWRAVRHKCGVFGVPSLYRRYLEMRGSPTRDITGSSSERQRC